MNLTIICKASLAVAGSFFRVKSLQSLINMYSFQVMHCSSKTKRRLLKIPEILLEVNIINYIVYDFQWLDWDKDVGENHVNK